MNIALYGNGASGNHGCEAIIRGTTAFLGDGHHYTVISENPDEDRCYGVGQLADITVAKTERKIGLDFLKAYAKLKLMGNYVDMDGLYYLPGIRAQKGQTDIALSVGGDNYCYGGTGIYAYLNKAYHKHNIKTILWGCSVEPEVVTIPEVAKDLAAYDAIVTRESITYGAVKEVQKSTFLMPDPAFFMEPVACDLDCRFHGNAVIGINISPMIISAEKESGMAYENYKRLIAWILKNTDACVALIPHVIWASNDDRTVLRRLYEEFDCDSRLILVEDHTAPELKYVISHCQAFVGARTHATIAAYSSCVPTLVVGYSVKARGIARDLFGTEDGYVLPVQQLREAEQLTEAFKQIWQQRASLKAHLCGFLPGYLERGKDLPKILAAIHRGNTGDKNEK